MSAYTTKYRLTKPTVGGDADAWGGLLNSDMDSLDTLLGVIATGGSANAYTLTTGQSLTAYADGQTFNVRASFANTGGATMNIDAIGAKNLRKVVSGTLTALASGDIASGDYMRVSYNLASDVIVVHGGSSTLDATLVAMAAGTTGADVLWYWSGTDTLSTTTLTAAGRALLDDAAASNQRTTLGLGDAALATLGTSGDTVPKNNTNNTFSVEQTFTRAGNTARFVNTTDSAGLQAARFESDRATPTAGDIVYVSFMLSDSVGTQEEFGRFGIEASTVTNGAEAAEMRFSIMAGGALTNKIGINNTAMRPLANDGIALGTTTLSYADLFLASGGVINWNNGDVTITHSANALAFAGASNGYTFDAPLLGSGGSAGNPSLSVNSADPDNGAYYIGTNNWALSAGGSKVVDIAATGVEVTGTLRGRLPSSSETGGTLSAVSANKVVVLATAPTMPASVFTAGDVVALYNDTAAAMTITQGASLTQRLSGTATTGNLTLAARGSASVYFKSATECVVSGSVS